MKKIVIAFSFLFFLTIPIQAFSQPDSIVLRDIKWDENAAASMTELFIPSEKSVVAGFIYTANGPQKHPTLIMLHGYPGNERNLDLAQVVRSHGWNVIYFDYRGSWGSGGQFSFANCVQDVVHVVDFCKKYSDSLRIDTSDIALFGHSMGGWVCLKALQQLPGIKKGFALSTWDIYSDFKDVKNEQQLEQLIKQWGLKYFVLNTPPEQMFKPVIADLLYYDLKNDNAALSEKEIIMLDEDHRNKELAAAIKNNNPKYFDYEVWDTDHPFSNKRISLMNKVLAFLKMK